MLQKAALIADSVAVVRQPLASVVMYCVMNVSGRWVPTITVPTFPCGGEHLVTFLVHSNVVGASWCDGRSLVDCIVR